jgi:hypothetical protein
MRSSQGATSGIIGVSEEFHRVQNLQSRLALNFHEEGDRDRTDLVVLPSGP